MTHHAIGARPARARTVRSGGLIETDAVLTCQV
jgi:hypothetical protein